MEINDKDELLVLHSILTAFRFLHNDYDKKDLYGSPYTGKIHKKIIDELKIKLTDIKFLANETDHILDNRPIYINHIKMHVENIDNWSELSNEIKKKTIHDFIFPFTLSESIIDELIK